MHYILSFVEQHIIGIAATFCAITFTRFVSGLVMKLMVFAIIGVGVYYTVAGVH